MWTVRCNGSEARVCRKTLAEIIPFIERLGKAGKMVYVAYIRKEN